MGIFCSATERALRQFQDVRGLHVTGECDEVTWRALVEANWTLGDRRLFLTSPNMRGDDVTDLQTLLGRLGFDCGRIDGILGPRTAAALASFQSEIGIAADGVCGPESLRALSRVIGQTGSGPGVSAVREVERLRAAPRSLASMRVAVGNFGGFGSLTRAVVHELRVAGVTAVAFDEPDAVSQARGANSLVAHAYLGFEAGRGEESVVHYYRVPQFESVGGRTLAEVLTAALRPVLPMGEPAGMRLPILRETRMPAVLCTWSPVRQAVDAAPAIARATLQALITWVDVCTLSLD